MAAIVKADSADLWSLYLSISNIREMANEECTEIKKVLNSLSNRIQLKIQQIRQQISQLEGEASVLQRRINNSDEPSQADMQKLQAIKARIGQLEQFEVELRKTERKIPAYEEKLKNQNKSCISAFRKGKLKVSKYLRFIEQLDEEDAYNEYAKSEQVMASATSSSVSSYFKMTFRGITFYCNDELLCMDSNEEINLARMEKGLAPIGPDGRPVNLHHMQQSERYGAVLEISETKHKDNHHALHNNTPDIPSGINRSAFASLKSAFWKRRAAFYKKSRGL